MAGVGDTDNGLFTIVGDELRTNAALDYEALGSPLNIRVQTGDSGTGNLTFQEALTVTLTDQNESPTDIDLAPSTVVENVPVGTVVGTLSTSDPDPGDTHSYSLVAGVGDTDNGLFTIVGDELRTNAALDYEALGSPLNIRVQTGDSGTGNLTFQEALTVTLTDQNESPTDIDLAPSTVVENVPVGTVVGTLSTSDPDPGDTHSYSLVVGVGDGDNALFTIVGDELRTNAALDYEALGSPLNIRVQTGDSGTGNLTFQEALTVTLTDQNESPTDIDLAPSTVVENVPVGTVVGTLSTSDPDPGDTHSYSLVVGVGDGDNALFTIVGDELRTNAALDYEALGSPLSIRVETTDSGTGNLTFEEALTVTLNDVNEAPTDIGLAPASVVENVAVGTVVGTLSTSDPDPSDTHLYSLVVGVGDGDNGLFTIVGDELRTVAALDFETLGTSLDVRVETTDSGTGNLTYSEALTVTLTDGNDAPSDIALSSTLIGENQSTGTTVGTLTSTDVDSAAFTYSLVAGAGDTDNARFSIGGGGFDELLSAEVFDFETQGPFSVRVQTDDGAGGTFVEVFVITLTDVNEAPTDISLAPSAVDENVAVGTVVGTLSTADPDPSDTHIYSLVVGVGDGDNGLFTIVGDQVQTAAALDFETLGSSLNVRIETTDSGTGNLTFEEALTVTLNDVNDAPVLDPVGPASGDEGTLIGFTATASDSDVPANSLLFSLEDGAGSVPAGASITAGGVFTFTPTEVQGPGVYSFDMIVTDDGTPNMEDRETITVTVAEVNVAPVLDPVGPQSGDEGTLIGFTATASDVDVPADGLTFTLEDGAGSVPAGASITAAGVFTWTPTEAQGPGVYSFDVVVTDDGTGLLEDRETITVTVAEVNVAPVLDPVGPQSGDEGTLIGFTATATDSDVPGSFTFTLEDGLGSVPPGAVITAGGVFTFTPSEVQGPGVYSFDVVVTDNTLLEDRETITVTVTEANIAPALDPVGPQSGGEGTLIGFTATASDVDVPADTLTFSLEDGLGSVPPGAVITAGGVFTFTPTEAQGPGVYSFDVVVADDGAGLLTDRETITVTVAEVNVAPVLDPVGPQSGDEGTLIGFTATASDVDVPANTLTFSLDDGLGSVPAGAVMTAGGVFMWTPTEAQGPGVYSFDVVVTDDGAGLLEDRETITVTVNEVNVAPVLDPVGAQSGDEGTVIGFTATASDVDVPADGLTFSLEDGLGSVPPGAVMTAGGVFTFTPTEAQGPGVYSFDVVVTDDGAGLLSDRETITVTVNEVNIAPVLDPVGAQSGDEGTLIGFTATATDSDVPADSLTFTLGGRARVGAGGCSRSLLVGCSRSPRLKLRVPVCTPLMWS